MKNIYKTIVVWLLTAIMGSIIFATMNVIAAIIRTGSAPRDIVLLASFSAFFGLICLGVSLPAIYAYHFLAVKLYSQWQNPVKIKTALGFYAVCTAFLGSAVFAIFYGGRVHGEWFLLGLPYAFAAAISAIIFRYRPVSTQKEQNDDSIILSNQTP